ncbi:MAG: VIT and VWA domain-containing protein [Gemmatimonadota bacterium]|nr:VIT and VWA domain-containing protein [Gemmatimonadota bacterium]
MRQSSAVHAELANGVLRYEVTEVFVNRGSGIGEADYLFPLPKGAAFQDLKLSINGELVSGETMSAAEARQIYEQIVRQQRDPALVEWMGYGLLRTRIFPIAAGEQKKVVVRFQSVAEREGDALRMDYFRGTKPGPEVRQSNPEARLAFTLTYPSDATYGNAYSPTHSLRTARAGSKREVTVNGDGREITLLVPVRRSTAPSISMLTYAPAREPGFALITLSPPSVAPRVTDRDVTLALDVSGSMSGVKIRQAREAGKQLLATLGPADRFRLVDFSTDVRTFRDEFVFATSRNVRAASEYLESLDASGSTNISGALEEALRPAVTSGRLGLVLFVTDGEPTVGERDPEAIAARVASLRGSRRIFSFGVGAELNVSLVERLALEGRGSAHFVRPNESVERAVSIVASRLTSPVITDMRVYADGVRLLKTHPSQPADIFAGQDFVMLARYEREGSTRLRFAGMTAGGPVEWSSRVVFPAASRENSFIARLWATQRVGYLSAEKRRHGGSSEVDDEIRELGERYGIPTEFSSYLVLEPGMDPRQQRGNVNAPPPVALQGRVESRAVTGAAPTASAKSTFESARVSADQRAATTLSAADEASGVAGNKEGLRRAGNRLFAMRDNVWTDTGLKDSMRRIQVRAYSSAYFRLLELLPELREPFALGDRVIAAGRSVAIEISPTGTESLTESELRDLQSRW